VSHLAFVDKKYVGEAERALRLGLWFFMSSLPGRVDVYSLAGQQQLASKKPQREGEEKKGPSTKVRRPTTTY
jgi:hypothetical protein